MKTVGARLAGLVVSTLLLALAPGASAEHFRLGLMANYTTEADPKDVEGAMRLWVRELGAEEGAQGESVVYRELPPLVADFGVARLDMAAMKSVDYLRVAKALGGELALTSVRGGKRTRRYLLLTRAEERVEDLAGLRDKRLAVVAGDELGLLHLETLLLRQQLGTVDRFFREIDRKAKASQAALAVFFKQADACIITDASFRTMVELNPQTGQRLAAAIRSPELIDDVAVFRRAYSTANKATVLKVSQRLRQTPRGRQVMMLFKFDALEPVNEGDLESVRRLLDEHDQLQAARGRGR